MAKPLSVARRQEIIESYQGWDPDNSTIDELARDLGVSKQTIYLVLGRNNIPLKTKAPAALLKSVPDMPAALLEEAFRSTLDALADARARVHVLEGRLRAAGLSTD